MGWCLWISRYWTQRLIPWKPGRVGATVWVARRKVEWQISIILIREMCCILPSVCTNFQWYSISALWRACPVNGSAAINTYSYAESFLKGVSNFIRFKVGNH